MVSPDETTISSTSSPLLPTTPKDPKGPSTAKPDLTLTTPKPSPKPSDPPLTPKESTKDRPPPPSLTDRLPHQVKEEDDDPTQLLSLSGLTLDDPPLDQASGASLGYAAASGFVPYGEYTGGFNAPGAGGGFSYMDRWDEQTGGGAAGLNPGMNQGLVNSFPPGSEGLIGTTRYGTVKFFSEQKGYGFILDYQSEELGGGEVFVHYTAIQAVQAGPNSFRSLGESESVEYTLTTGPKGWQAQNVTGPNGAPCIGSSGINSGNNSGQQQSMSQSTRGGKGGKGGYGSTRGGRGGEERGGGGGTRSRGDSGFFSGYGSPMGSPRGYQPIPLSQYPYPIPGTSPYGSPPPLPPNQQHWQPGPALVYPYPFAGVPPPIHQSGDSPGERGSSASAGSPKARNTSGHGSASDPYRPHLSTAFYPGPGSGGGDYTSSGYQPMPPHHYSGVVPMGMPGAPPPLPGMALAYPPPPQSLPPLQHGIPPLPNQPRYPSSMTEAVISGSPYSTIPPPLPLDPYQQAYGGWEMYQQQGQHGLMAPVPGLGGQGPMRWPTTLEGLEGEVEEKETK